MSIRILLTGLLLTGLAYGQQRPHCGADEYLQDRLREDPTLRQAMTAFDNLPRTAQAQKTAGEGGTQYVIPLVVHVVHDGKPETPDSISLAQIQSQFDVLFRDYRRQPGTIGWGMGVDMQIEFQLATRDPDGKPTTGVVYHNDADLIEIDRRTPRNDRELKAAFRWDAQRYLNIYVVNTIVRSGSDQTESVLGYSVFPFETDLSLDGIVLRYDCFGTTGAIGGPGGANRGGRTLTHELGHWLGLYHPFQGGCGSDCRTTGDRMCDTPPTAAPYFGDFNARRNSCTNDQPDRPDNPRNYMDYLDDAGYNFFTAEQKAVAFATLNNTGYPQRNKPWQPANVQAAGAGQWGPHLRADFIFDNPSPCTGTPVRFYDCSAGSPTTYHWSFPDGGDPATSSEANPVVTYASQGLKSVTLVVRNAAGALDTIEKLKIITADNRRFSLPFNEDFTGAFPPDRWSVDNPDAANVGVAQTWLGSGGIVRLRCNAYNDYNQRDDLNSPAVSIDGEDNAVLTFRTAYAPFRWGETPAAVRIYTDTLEVWGTTDCGQSWTLIYRKGGAELATVPQPVETEMTSPRSDEWRRDSVCLSLFAGQKSLRLRFRAVNGYGNNIFLDDVRVASVPKDACTWVSGRAPEPPLTHAVVAPNPFDDEFVVQFETKTTARVAITVYDVQGRVVAKRAAEDLKPGAHRLPVRLDHAPAGLYLARLTSEGYTGTFRVLRID